MQSLELAGVDERVRFGGVQGKGSMVDVYDTDLQLED